MALPASAQPSRPSGAARAEATGGGRVHDPAPPRADAPSAAVPWGPQAAREKAFLAERSIAIVRAAVIAFNVFVWYVLWDRSVGVPWLAAVVSVVASAYALFVLAFRPYRWLPVLRTSLYTAVTDGALITLWLVATGASRSPFAPLWFVSLFAVAFRYRARGAVVATVLYVACYLGVLASDGSLAGEPAAALVPVAYVVFAGALAAMLGQETYRHIRSQVGARGDRERAKATQIELDLLRRLTSALGRQEDLAGTLGRVVAVAAQTAGWSVGEAWVPERDGRLRRCAVWTAAAPGLQAFAQEGAGLRLGRGEGLAGQAWTEGRILAGAAEEAPRGDSAVRAGLGAAIAVPLFAEGLTIAVLQFFMPRTGPDDERFAQLVAAATAQVGPALLRRQAEERFRMLSEAALEGICLHDRGVIVETNTAFARLVGHAPQDLVGLHLRRLVAPEHHALLRERLGEPATGRPFELRLLRKDGTRFLAEIQARDLPFQDRTVRVSAVRDVTERRKAEEADRLALGRQMEITRLQEVNRIKTHLLNTASHELNTPLTPLKLQLHLLATDRLGPLLPLQRRSVAVLQRNVDRLSGLVHDVLDVARLQGTGLRLDPTEVDAAEVLAEVRDAFAEAAREKGVRLVTGVPRPVVLRADRDRLVQVLFNLVSNAIKFTDKGRVMLRAEVVGDEAGFHVDDTGRGLTREQMERLFQPFSQVHEPGSTRVRGTGLGLYICKGIVEQHGGTMWVDSAGPGRGSRFGFRLPLAGPPTGPRPAGGPAAARPPRPSPAAPHGRHAPPAAPGPGAGVGPQTTGRGAVGATPEAAAGSPDGGPAGSAGAGADA